MQMDSTIRLRFGREIGPARRAPAPVAARPALQTHPSPRRLSGASVLSGKSSRAGPTMAREIRTSSLEIRGAQGYCARIAGSGRRGGASIHHTRPGRRIDLPQRLCISRGLQQRNTAFLYPYSGCACGGLPNVGRIIRIPPCRAKLPIRGVQRRHTPSSTDIANSNASRSGHAAGPIVRPGRAASGHASFQPQPGEL